MSWLRATRTAKSRQHHRAPRDMPNMHHAAIPDAVETDVCKKACSDRICCKHRTDRSALVTSMFSGQDIMPQNHPVHAS
jgi:hypothetical protein